MNIKSILWSAFKVYRGMDGSKTNGGIVTAVLVAVTLAVLAQYGIVLDPSILVAIFAPLAGWIGHGFRDAMKKGAKAAASAGVTNAVEAVKEAIKSGDIDLEELMDGRE